MTRQTPTLADFYAAHALFDGGPARKRRVAPEYDFVAPAPKWMPDDTVALAGVVSLSFETVDTGRPMGELCWWDEHDPEAPDLDDVVLPQLCLDIAEGCLFVVGYTARMRGHAFCRVRDLEHAPSFLPADLPVTGRLKTIVYESVKFGESEAVLYTHTFAPACRPPVVNDTPRNAYALPGWGRLYDVTARGIVDVTERMPGDESLVLAPWPGVSR